jgi:glutathione synthase/RimK-type ligase-like ATP-grasp enzyme
MEMIRVGRCSWTKSKKPTMKDKNSLKASIMLIAKSFNVELFLFTPSEVDFGGNKIRGLFFENGKQVYKTVPIPPLIDNSMRGFSGYSEFCGKMSAYAHLVQPFVKPEKLRTHKTLEADGRYADWLVPSVPVPTFKDVKAALDEFGSRIIIKSIRGAGGKAVYAVSRDGNMYEIHRGHAAETLDESAAEVAIGEIIEEKPHIAQPFIRSQTVYGEPADFRISCRRGKGGKFFVDVVPRVGNPKGIISNISNGGYVVFPKVFFPREFGENGMEEHKKLMKFGEEFANHYQSLFPKHTTSNVGIDVGFQRENGRVKYYIFEVNAYMGTSFSAFMRASDAVNQLEYYRYLWDKHNLGQ